MAKSPHRWREGGMRMRMWRDQGGKCCYCEEQMVIVIGEPEGYMPNRATVEHLQCRSRGGSDRVGNKRLACASCNNSKGSRSWLEWKTICMKEEISE